MSGIEALSFACNIFQAISFARETSIVCRDIYNGQKGPDPQLEEKAATMILASQWVKSSSSHPSSTPEEQALVDIAQKCTETATKLDEEVAAITKKHKRGRVLGALNIRFHALWKQGEVERLDKAPADYTSTMQVLLIEQIW